MKRYIKSSFEITFKPQYKYKSYKEYCYDTMQGYYDEELTEEDYKKDIAQVEGWFKKYFNQDFYNTPVIEAKIGFVTFMFFVIGQDLYYLNWNEEKIEIVDDAWLKQFGCKTTLDEIHEMLNMW